MEIMVGEVYPVNGQELGLGGPKLTKVKVVDILEHPNGEQIVYFKYKWPFFLNPHSEDSASVPRFMKAMRAAPQRMKYIEVEE